MADISNKANLIWAIADKLTGAYKPHEYGEVILPMTVIRRFDCILEETKDDVLGKYEEVKDIAMRDILLKNASQQPFYNVSRFTLIKLTDDPDNLEANLRNYINGFSDNVKEILDKFEFDSHITRMADKKILYMVVKEFTSSNADLHPSVISNIEMGYIFEEMIRRFSESYNEDAGQHYTPREVIELMVNILFEDDDILAGNGRIRTLYDPACGTGGMLSVAKDHLLRLNSESELYCYGQEINDYTYAVCKADTLIKGSDNDIIENGNTLSQDKFENVMFDYVLSNPPFGREWKNEQTAVKREHAKGDKGRFPYGMPAVSDSQMLFLQAALSKLKVRENGGGGKMAIIHNGSPLFTGDAGSGPSEIRRGIIENDLLDAIIGLPNDIFYNTGITTYIWVLSSKKTEHRRGKIQLINATQMFVKRRKSLGNKRNDIPQDAIDEITRIYGEFRESDVSKIFDNEDFGYSKITVERPIRDKEGNIILKKGKPQADKDLRDTENVPLKEDIDEYLKREVLPFAPDAWIDESKTKVGYEIPFTRYFYKYTPPRPSKEILQEIIELEDELQKNLKELFE